jgi:enterochelin esterase-like enzyme/sugar lactone lactonase YvrE
LIFRLDLLIVTQHEENHPMIRAKTSSRPAIYWLFALAFSAMLAAKPATAQDWTGPFTIIPASAPEMAMEAVDAGVAEGTKVSISNPSGKDHQKWIVTPKGNGFYSIRPAHGEKLVLAADAGGKADGTRIVLQKDTGGDWQLWAIRKNPNGSFSLTPKHAPEQGIDDFAGGNTPGTRLDLWTYKPDDEHLQWMLKPLAGATWPVAAGDLNAPIPPKGTIKEFKFEESAIFPGTRRSGTVFIPAQYDGSKAACVYVRQDGYNAREKAMLEAMIAAGEMPVTIGVFIRPGDLPAPMPGTMGRRNRCFEYDGVGDNYVRFLVEELLPYVAKTFDLKLSDNGNDRCIAGGSSGGISAFNAAWERPDAFSRVYANSGSFVAFRGGHEFPTLIRKFEAKPMRAYLTTGTRDMENCAGDWYLLDQEMDKALKFSGYDYEFHALDGGHVAGWNEHFAPAMRYIWKGWPEPVKAGPSAPRVRDVIGAGGKWELAGQGFRDARGPACNAKGEVFFVDVGNNHIQRIGLDGMVGVFAADAAGASSLSVGPKGELYSVSSTTGRILCYDDAGKPRVYAEGIHGQHVLAMPTGGLYVTCAEEKPAEGSTVWFVKDGQKTRVDAGLKLATGLAYRPDQWLLSVADGRSKWLYSFQIKPDGTLANKERFFWLHVPDWEDDAGAESVCYAKEGQMFVTTRYGIQVCADDGPTQVILPMPDRSRVIGVCLGGPELNTLYAFCGDKVWKRVIKLHAIGAFSPWVKVNGTPL